MSIRTGVPLLFRLLGAYIVLTAIAGATGLEIVATPDAPSGFLTVLLSRSVQSVLAVSLLAVSGALVAVSRLLVRAYEARIAALEKAVQAQAAAATALAAVAKSMDELRNHCRDRNGGG